MNNYYFKLDSPSIDVNKSFKIVEIGGKVKTNIQLFIFRR